MEQMHLLTQENIKIFSSESSKTELITKILEENFSTQPKFLVDLGEVIELYNNWTKNLPNITPYYAVKCNPNPMMIQLLYLLGCGFDCASKNEILQILGLNIPAEKIIYANPIKEAEFIKLAEEKNVNIMTFDNEKELYKIKKHHPNAKIVLRIKTDDSKSIHKFSVKFGCAMSEVSDILKTVKSLDLNLIGVSFHVGSKCNNPEAYSDSIKNAREIFRRAERLGMNLYFLDIGGGFPGCKSDSKSSFEEMATEIKKAIEEHFSDVEGLQIIGEPGRYFATKPPTVLFNVIGKKKIIREDGTVEFIYYMNDGIYGSFNCIKFDDAEPKIIPLKQCDETRYLTTMYGPTCDSIDCIFKNKEYPELEIGDWCYVNEFGAYTSSASSKFNGFNDIESIYFMKM